MSDLFFGWLVYKMDLFFRVVLFTVINMICYEITLKSIVH